MNSFCRQVFCEGDSGPREQCTTICTSKCLRPCYLQLLALESAVSSADKCRAMDLFHACIVRVSEDDCPPRDYKLIHFRMQSNLYNGIDPEGADGRLFEPVCKNDTLRE